MRISGILWLNVNFVETSRELSFGIKVIGGEVVAGITITEVVCHFKINPPISWQAQGYSEPYRLLRYGDVYFASFLNNRSTSSSRTRTRITNVAPIILSAINPATKSPL